MMLPFADAEPVALRLVRGRRQPGQANPPLVIHLHTRNKDLGEVWLQTRISDETEVDMVMWALREDVVKRARDLSPNLAFSHDVDGYGPTFNEGSKAISIGLDATLNNTYNANLSVTNYIDGDYGVRGDRDFVSLSLGVNF